MVLILRLVTIILIEGGARGLRHVGEFNKYAEKFSVETTVPEFGAPRRIFEGDTFYESHTSVIEEYEFKIDSKATKEGNKHKNFSIDIHILGRQCPGLVICFGHNSNLGLHKGILEKIGHPSMDDKRYEVKMSEEVTSLNKEGMYVVDACEGMTVIEVRLPEEWIVPNTPFGPYQYSPIFFSGVGKGRKSDPIGHKMAGISNWERITFYHKHRTTKGVELFHGPVNYTAKDGKNYWSTGLTTFYETTDLFDEEHHKKFYVVLAQKPHLCRARLKPRKLTAAFMVLQYGFSFRPTTVFAYRKGINVWAISFGFIFGCLIGSTAVGMFLCVKSKTLYTQWNVEMRKVYGKFATVDATTVGGETTLGGTTMGGLSMMGNTTGS